MRHVELIVFENDSILNEKALSLPIGKVSFRQLGVILVGVLAAMISYFVTKEIIVPGVVLAASMGLGMINTRIMTPDQMIKANLLYLIRGTSLRKKPEKTPQLSKNETQTNPHNTTTNNKGDTTSKRKEQDDKKKTTQKIFSQIESFFVKPSKKKNEPDKNNYDKNDNNKDNAKSYAVRLQLMPNNMLQILPVKQDTKNHDSNQINKILSSLNKSFSLGNSNNKEMHVKFLQEHIAILLDNQNIDDSKMIFRNDNSMTILLDESSRYDVSVIADGKRKEVLKYD